MRGILVDLMLALRGIVRQPRRSALSALAICGGVVALMLAGGFVEWNFWNYRESAIASQLGHLRISKAGFSKAGQADPFAYLLPESAPELERVRSLPGVRSVAPRLHFSGLVSAGESTVSFLAEGVDPAAERGLDKGLRFVAGRNLAPKDANGVVLGEGLAENLGVRVGDKVALLANTRSGGVNAIECEVLGVFSTISKAYDDAALRLPRADAQRLLRVKGAHAWVVLLDDTERTDSAYDALRAAFAGRGLEVSRWIDASDFYRKSMELYAKQMLIMKLIIAAIIVLSISNSQMMSVIERTGEVGTAMALGSRGAVVLRRFLVEGLMLGVAGALVGVALGAGAALLLSWIGIPLPPAPGMAHGYDGEILVSAPIALDAAVLAVATTCVASVYPAWKASRLVIVDALRFNR